MLRQLRLMLADRLHTRTSGTPFRYRTTYRLLMIFDKKACPSACQGTARPLLQPSRSRACSGRDAPSTISWRGCQALAALACDWVPHRPLGRRAAAAGAAVLRRAGGACSWHSRRAPFARPAPAVSAGHEVSRYPGLLVLSVESERGGLAARLAAAAIGFCTSRSRSHGLPPVSGG